jgi:hypothetical protein
MSTLPPTPPAPGRPPWPQVVPSRPQRWPMFASLVIALLATGLAIGCWLRPMPGTKASPTAPVPSYTDQQVTEAKASVCAAFAKVDHALDISGARKSGDDPAMQLAVAASGRQVLDAGSRYLLTKLAEEPATPPDLATAVRQQANSFQELMIGYLDEISNSAPEQQPALKASDDATATLRRLCK